MADGLSVRSCFKCGQAIERVRFPKGDGWVDSWCKDCRIEQGKAIVAGIRNSYHGGPMNEEDREDLKLILENAPLLWATKRLFREGHELRKRSEKAVEYLKKLLEEIARERDMIVTHNVVRAGGDPPMTKDDKLSILSEDEI